MTCWNQALHEYLLGSPPEGEDEDAIAQFLCTPWSRDTPVLPGVVNALRQWLNKNTPLVHRYALSSALQFTDDLHALAGPLLCWGVERPWGHLAQAQSIMNNWANVLDVPNLYSDHRADNMAYAACMVLEMLPKLAPTKRGDVASSWATMLLDGQTLLWQPNNYSAETRARVLAAWPTMHAIASCAFGAIATQMWQEPVDKAFENMSYGQAAALLALVTSPRLPDDAKIHGACCASSQAWMDAEVHQHLAPIYTRLFPSCAERIHFMPWHKESHNLRAAQCSDANRRMCEWYCPELIAVFALYPVDWNDRIGVFNLADKHLQTPAFESYSLGSLLDPGTEQSNP